MRSMQPRNWPSLWVSLIWLVLVCPLISDAQLPITAVDATPIDLNPMDGPTMRPTHMALSTDRTRLFVTNTGPGGTFNVGSVSIIDTVTNTVAGNIRLRPGFPAGILVMPGAAGDPSSERIYLAMTQAVGDDVSSGTNRVEVINAMTSEIEATIPIETTSIFGPTRVAITPDNQFVYVSIRGSGEVAVISTATNEVVETIVLPDDREPVDLVITGDNTRAYVGSRGTLSPVVDIIDWRRTC